MTKTNLVVKSNELIEARHSLSMNEQKMILYAVSKINKNDKQLNKIRIKARDFIDLLDVTSKDRYGAVKNIAKSLTTESIHIEKENGGWILLTWLSSAEYIPNEAIIEMEFSEKLIPYLLQLKENFTRYELQNVIYMRSRHSIRLYELLKQYQTIGVRRFSLDEFREFMDLKGSYPRTYDLEKHVVKVAIEEINDLTDIRIDYDRYREGRSIAGFIFMINSTKLDEKLWVEYLKEYYDINQIQEAMGLKDEKLDPIQVMNLYEIAVSKSKDMEMDPFLYAKTNYIYVREKKKNIKNFYSYLNKALEEDYANAGFLLKMQKELNL